MPTLRLLHSSHATGAAMVLSALGQGGHADTAPPDHSPLTPHHSLRLPPVALIGGLEAAMYHCDCSQNRHFWDIGKGIVQWGKLNGRALTVTEKCLRSANAAERCTFADYQQEIDAGRAVILTFSFDDGSEMGLNAAKAAQQRVSVVGVGYRVSSDQSPVTSSSSSLIAHLSSLILVLQLPDEWLERPPARERDAVEKLKGLLPDDPSEAQRKHLRWEVLSESAGNIVFTFVQTGTPS